MTREAYDQVMKSPHKAHLSHEVIAAAASYEAVKAWNDHKQKNGEEVSHGKAKEFLAAAAGAFVTHVAETKGLDALDHHKAKKLAEEHHEKHLKHHGY